MAHPTRLISVLDAARVAPRLRLARDREVVLSVSAPNYQGK